MSDQKGDLAFLKERLRGPIIHEIIDPKDHDTDDILKSYFLEILFLARKFARPTVEFEDLVVEGLMGLLDAIERFDIDKAKGNKRAFHNLAVVRIKSYMFEFFLANNSQYTIPNYMARAMNLVEQLRNVLYRQDFFADTEQVLRNLEVPEFEEKAPADLAKRVNVIKGKLASLASNSDKTYEAMIETVLGVEQDIESCEAGEEGFEVSPEEITEQREFLDKFLGGLQPTARDVMTKLLEGKTLEEVGKEIGVTRERARQIKEETLGFFHRTRMYQDAATE